LKNSLFKGKSTRTKIFTVITALSIAVLLVLNLVFTYFGLQGTIYVDMTPEGFYTLSENMKNACTEILDTPDKDGNKKNIKITFCSDPDMLSRTDALRPTYFMALALRNMFDNFEVETVNVNVNPASVSQYKTTSRQEITYKDVIISYNGRYKIADASTFWTQNNFSYNGEYRMVTILASLTALNSPVAYFLTDHGESYYDPDNPESEMSLDNAYLADLITDRGLVIKTLELSAVERIPEDCALLIINNPKTDFAVDEDRLDELGYVSDTEKIDRYLVSHEGAIIVNKDYKTDLPVLEQFLSEWGIMFGDALVKDENNCIDDGKEFGTTVLGVYDKESIGAGFYEDYANLASAPKMVFTNSGYIYSGFKDSPSVKEPGSMDTTKTYSTFINTSFSAKAYLSSDSTVLVSGEGVKNLAAMSVRKQLDGYTSEYVYSYVFATNSADFFSNEILGNSSYANYDIMASVIDNISRKDRYADMSLGGTSLNSPSFGGKQTVSTTLKTTDENVYSPDASQIIATNKGISVAEISVYTTIIFAVPVVLMVAGLAVYIRRKFL